MTLYKATLETRNFSFEAYGTTEGEARLALYSGLNVHAAQYSVTASNVRDLKVDVEVRAIEVGKCYRDREVLP